MLDCDNSSASKTSAHLSQHQFSEPALRRAVYSTRCLSKGLGAGAALYCMAKTNTDLFSLVGKTMVNSAEWNQLGIFVSFFLFYDVNAPVPTRHSHVGFSLTSSTSQNSVVFNLMGDGEYWNHRPFKKKKKDISLPFVSCADVAGFCSPQCMLTELVFYSMWTFTACVWFDFAGIPLWFQSACDFPCVTISNMWRIDLILDLPGFCSYTNYLDTAKMTQSFFFFFFQPLKFDVWGGKKIQDLNEDSCNSSTCSPLLLSMWAMCILAYVITKWESLLEWHESTIVCSWSCEFHSVWWHQRSPILPADTCWGGQRLSCWA